MIRMVRKKLTRLMVGVGILLFFCEFAVYYLALMQCSWPGSGQGRDTVLKTMFVADTHLLGPVRGHWFDKLRREWQMHRSFATAVQIFDPEVVFFLGDVFDEGQLVSSIYFDRYVDRFHSLFSVPPTTRTYVVAGNHDMGFHYRISHFLKSRFEKAFNSSSVRRIRLKGVNFILINSMAMEGDGCDICKPAMKKILKISEQLNCENRGNETAVACPVTNTRAYSRPILLQHFPLYRKSDEFCIGEDAAPVEEKRILFREKLDCVSASSSQFLLEKLEPRLVLSGHTHHGCLVKHQVKTKNETTILIPEHSVPSFSWRNRNDPSFILAHFTTENYELLKCKLPRENTVKFLYVIGANLVILWTAGYVPHPSRVSIFNFVCIIVVDLTVYFFILCLL